MNKIGLVEGSKWLIVSPPPEAIGLERSFIFIKLMWLGYLVYSLRASIIMQPAAGCKIFL